MNYEFEVCKDEKLVKLQIYYRLKRMTKNQEKFCNDIIKSLNSKEEKLFMHNLSPILDKDYLTSSIIVSQAREFKENIVLVLNDEKSVYKAVESMNKINNSFIKIDNNKNNPHNKTLIIPFLERKLMCINEDLLKNSYAFDLDYYCLSNINKSNNLSDDIDMSNKIQINLNQIQNQNQKCCFYDNFIDGFENNSKEINQNSNTYNNDNSIQNENLNSNSMKNKLKISISYDFDVNDNNLYDSDFINFSIENKICPFYLAQNKIKNSTGTIVVTTYSEILSTSSSLNELVKDFKYVFNETEFIKSEIEKNFTCYISDKILNNSIYEINSLKKEIKNENSNEYIEKYYQNQYSNKIIKSLILKINKNTNLNVNIDRDSNTNEKNVFPGNIQSETYFLRNLSKLIEILKNKVLLDQQKQSENSGSETSFSIIHIKYRLLKENFDNELIPFLWMRLNCLISRRNDNPKNYYHILHVIKFLSLLEIYESKVFLSCFLLSNYRFESKKILESEKVIEISLLNSGLLTDLIFNFSFIRKNKESSMIFEKNSSMLSNYIRLNNSIPINMLNIEEESELFLNYNKSAKIWVSGMLSNKNFKIIHTSEFNNSAYISFVNVDEYSDEENLIFKKTIEYAYVSPDNTKNLTFYANVINQSAEKVPKGLIVLFSSYKLLREYIYLWNISNSNFSSKENSLFNNVSKNRLIFVEGSNSSNNLFLDSEIIKNYKLAIDNGMNAVLFTSIRGKLADNLFSSIKGDYSKGIVFLGLPVDTMIDNNNKFNLKLNLNEKIYNIDKMSYLSHDIYGTINRILSSSIEDFTDKKIFLFLDENLVYNKDDVIQNHFSSSLSEVIKNEENHSYLEEILKKLKF